MKAIIEFIIFIWDKIPADKVIWLFKKTIYFVAVSAMLILSGCFNAEVSTSASVWNWKGFLQNLLQNFSWVDKSRRITTINGVDPIIVLYAVLAGIVMGIIVTAFFSAIVVILQVMGKRKLKKQFAQLVMNADFCSDIESFKELTHHTTLNDRSFRRRVNRYANLEK